MTSGNSCNQGQGTMILADEMQPFSIASIVSTLNEWNVPTSSA